MSTIVRVGLLSLGLAVPGGATAPRGGASPESAVAQPAGRAETVVKVAKVTFAGHRASAEHRASMARWIDEAGLREAPGHRRGADKAIEVEPVGATGVRVRLDGRFAQIVAVTSDGEPVCGPTHPVRPVFGGSAATESGTTGDLDRSQDATP